MNLSNLTKQELINLINAKNNEIDNIKTELNNYGKRIRYNASFKYSASCFTEKWLLSIINRTQPVNSITLLDGYVDETRIFENGGIVIITSHKGHIEHLRFFDNDSEKPLYDLQSENNNYAK